MNNYFLYLARFLSACCVYLFISKANIWLDKIDNSILVLGYRFFILLAPMIFMFSKKWTGLISFLLANIGILLWIFKLNFLGTILFSSGIAVGSYVIKYFSVKTPAGAAHNAIIFNLGVFLSGIILVLFPHSQIFLGIGLLLMVATLFCSCFIINRENVEAESVSDNFSLAGLKTPRGLAWAVVGLVCGIEFIGMFSILPQYLIAYYKFLPGWYGWIMPVSSLTVVALQHPIMSKMQNLNLSQTLKLVVLSMVVTALPMLFYCHYFIGAMTWVFILTLFECAIIYLDTLSSQEGNLLIKEVFVGVGMSLTVFIVRSMHPMSGALVMGGLGAILIMLASVVLAQPTAPSVRTAGT